MTNARPVPDLKWTQLQWTLLNIGLSAVLSGSHMVTHAKRYVDRRSYAQTQLIRLSTTSAWDRRVALAAHVVLITSPPPSTASDLWTIQARRSACCSQHNTTQHNQVVQQIHNKSK